MRALVTGSRGFVGSYLVRALSDAGWRVDRFRGDIRHPGPLGRYRGDAVFHLAAMANPGQSLLNPRDTLDVNVIGTLRLLQALRGFGGRVLVVSSGDVYRPGPRPRRETDEVLARNPYAFSKLMAERVARSHDGLDIVITRPFNHTGPGQARSYVCGAFAAQIRSGVRVLKVGDLRSVRDFTDVRDVVRAYLALVERGRRGETYNVASSKGVRIRDVLDTMIRLSRRSIRVVVDPARVRPPDHLVGDAGKLRRLTGWSPTIRLERTLRDMLDERPEDQFRARR